LKYFYHILILSVLLSALSCSSGKKDNMRSRHPDNTPEIGTTEILGGETIVVRGYTGDHEFNTKMKLLDLEIMDCYKQFVSGGTAQEAVLNLNVEIDGYGSVKFMDYKTKTKTEKKIAKCILRDIEELVFRPGSEREVNYRLVYKPTKSKKKKISKISDKRSRMIAALPDMAVFKKCYEAALSRNPHVGGDFTISFEITEKGEAKEAMIVTNSFRNTDVPLCVIKRLLKTYFPESDVTDKVSIKFKYGTIPPPNSSIGERKKTLDIDL
jgi:hypothetical protein